jgi:CBS domain-containing protein
MTIGKLCVRNVVTAGRDMSALDAAKKMRKSHVGNLVVVDQKNKKRVPAGIVTDRDIVIGVVAMGLDAKVFTIGDMLIKEVITCREDQQAEECLELMRTHGIRRLPVTDRKGVLVGIVTVDDLVRELAIALGDISRLIRREQTQEIKTRLSA